MKAKSFFSKALVGMLSLTMLLGNTPALNLFAAESASTDPSVSAPGNDDWLHAKGSKLYDMNGNEVWLTGANWFGFNCTEEVFHGLWSAKLEPLIKQIADRGINLLRVPVSTELLYSWMTGQAKEDINVNWYANPELTKADGTHMNSFEVFDYTMKLCKKYGIKVMVDVHSPHADNSGHVYELWYGKKMANGKTVTTDMWIDTWVWLVNQYKNDDTLIAVDLENEPHGQRGYTAQENHNFAKWDNSTDENNWRYAAEKCANAILDVNPNMLIVVEGIQQTPKAGYTYTDPDKWQSSDVYFNAWWGGNLARAKDYPINLGSRQSQLVYSPHDYGPCVNSQPWFDKDFTQQTLLDDYWYEAWAYLKEEDIAPLLMGEWGGMLEDAKTRKWMDYLADYMVKNKVNHTFWCLNPNSGDTGGLLNYDFTTWNEPKYEFFKKTLWQTNDGTFIGLDHQIPLGSKGTNVTAYYGGTSTNTPVTGVALNTDTLTLKEGETKQLQASVLPANATNKRVSYTSGNTSVASVDQNGKVTAKAQGTAVITVTTEDGKKTASCKVTVTKADSAPVAVSGVSLDKNNLTLAVGDTETLTATVAPKNAANQKVTFSSGNPSVATVDQKGKVTAKSAGTATITVTTEDGKKTASCTITVTKKDTSVAVKGVSLNKNRLNLSVGDAETLIASITPSDATNKNISFSSSNSSIASVDQNGRVTAKKAGKATITVTTEDGRKTASCDVVVEDHTSSDVKVPVNNISISEHYLELAEGSTVKLNAVVEPANATNKGITWSSNNPSVATVDDHGNVTALKEGNATITATSVDGHHTISCSLNVKSGSIHVNSMWLNTYWLQMKVGDSHQLVAYFSPTNATNKKVTYVSSNEKVITVSEDGVVTAVGQGSATVTSTSVDGHIQVVTQFVIN